MDQANKALRGLHRKLRNIPTPVDLQIKLFDALIAPILLHGSAILRFEKNGIVKNIHLQFFRNVLKVRIITPCYMIYNSNNTAPSIGTNVATSGSEI